MTAYAAGLAIAAALNAADRALISVLSHANRQLTAASGCTNMHAWLGSDADDRANAVVLYGFRSAGRRLGVLLHKDGTLELTISMPSRTGYMPVRAIQLTVANCTSVLHVHVADEPHATRRALSDRLAKAIRLASSPKSAVA
ncbi:hypothetical protein [Sphingomonas sp. 3-13AW]|uniref:hypothetical protein n=1 Tax=Sphingomonas sp. 3-13AW TaxID=3050450 RepID=UPI003BB4DB9D